MITIVIYGAGVCGRKYRDTHINNNEEILCFVDNDAAKLGHKIGNHDILPLSVIPTLVFDKIVIALQNAEEVYEQLKAMGVGHEKIEVFNYASFKAQRRNAWLTNLAEVYEARGIKGHVAEAGVYRGQFASHINSCFPDRTLYLFDTFEGFPLESFTLEAEGAIAKPGYHSNTSPETVMKKMPYPDRCIIKKGVFPHSAEGVSDQFCFVSLDMDLYKPTLAGLHFFLPKMTKGGIILIHDYYTDEYPGIKKAVSDFSESICESISICPIGDEISIAVIKN